MRRKFYVVVSLVVVGLVLVSAGLLKSVAEEKKSQATLTEMKGVVEILKEGEETWLPAEEGMPLERGDRVKTGKDSLAEITMDNGTVMKLEDNTDLTLMFMSFDDEKEEVVTHLAAGKVLSNVLKLKKPKSKMTIKTPTSVASVRGTEFVVDTDGNDTDVGVFDGEVNVRGLDDTGNELPDETIVKVNEQTTIKLRNRPLKAFAMKPKMAEYKEKVVRLKQRAENNRKRIHEFMKNREHVKERVLKNWQKTREDRLKKQIDKIKDKKGTDYKSPEKVYEEKKPKLLKKRPVITR